MKIGQMNIGQHLAKLWANIQKYCT